MAKPNLQDNRTDCGVGLSIKITVIVYWILVVSGFMAATPLLNHIEQNIDKQHTYNAALAHIKVLDMLQGNNSLTGSEIENKLDKIRESLGVPAINIKIDSQPIITSGIKLDDMKPTTIPFEIYTRGGKHESIHLYVYHTALKSAVKKLRSNVLLGMGSFFVILGTILAFILRRIIAKPFSVMVKTAEEFSNGNQNTRFDTDSTDEFSYLGHFINNILDKLLLQHRDLKQAHVLLKQSEAVLSKQKERIEVTLESISDGVITTHSNGTIEYLNPSAEKLLGFNMSEATGVPVEELIKLTEEETGSPIYNPVLTCLKDNTTIYHNDNAILNTKCNNRRAISYTVAPMGSADNKVVGTVMVIRDVEQNRKLARQLSYQASHDTLTDLFNRRAFEEHIKVALSTATMNDCYHALFYLDLDQFKIVNDTCGHVAGDALLQQLAELLRSRIRTSDVIARLGGDEFGILLQYCDARHAEIVAKDIVSLISNYRFSWDGRLFETGVSIGLVLITPESQTVEDILSAADMACYVAKENGRTQVHIYETNDDELAQRRGEMQWVSRIKEALEKDQFVLYSQPIAAINDESPDELHFEVLVRLLEDNGNVVPPMVFIPAAERFQLMPSIDRWVITQTFKHLLTDVTPGARYTCSINLSGQSLSDDNLMPFVEQMFTDYKIPPENICFEITETAAITHLDKAKRFIDTLSSKGCKFSLDDFGSGLSSFSYLKDLKVDYLKIDGIFIKEMVNNDIDYAMVKSINDIGHVLNLQTIAEFVENTEILNQLKSLGVNYAQGYGISKPYPMKKVLASLDHKQRLRA